MQQKSNVLNVFLHFKQRRLKKKKKESHSRFLGRFNKIHKTTVINLQQKEIIQKRDLSERSTNDAIIHLNNFNKKNLEELKSPA